MLSVLPPTRDNPELDLLSLFNDSSEISRVRPNTFATATYLPGSSFPSPCLNKCLAKAPAAWACRRESHLDNGVPVMDTYRVFERNIHDR